MTSASDMAHHVSEILAHDASAVPFVTSAIKRRDAEFVGLIRTVIPLLRTGGFPLVADQLTEAANLAEAQHDS